MYCHPGDDLQPKPPKRKKKGYCPFFLILVLFFVFVVPPDVFHYSKIIKALFLFQESSVHHNALGFYLRKVGIIFPLTLFDAKFCGGEELCFLSFIEHDGTFIVVINISKKGPSVLTCCLFIFFC